MNDGILGIERRTYKDCNVYGVRGTGLPYNIFYNWFSSVFESRYRTIREDMPWHYFIFEPPHAENDFLDNKMVLDALYESIDSDPSKPFNIEDWI